MKPVPSSQDQEIFRILDDLKALKASYPPELLAARRAAFMEQVDRRAQAEIPEESTLQGQKIIDRLMSLRFMRVDYPPKLWAARRSAFKRQIAFWGWISALGSLRSALQNGFSRLTGTLSGSSTGFMRLSLVVAGIALVAFVGFLLQGERAEPPNPSADKNGISRVVPISTTSIPKDKIICKPGYEPPLCLARAFDKSQDLTFAGNGSARPAVAKDTVPGNDEIHSPAHINDGMYGPGSSWVSNSPDSWIKIDLGKATAINIVAFGRDRLGKLNDRNPGQFIISVALTDDVYADGNSSNDQVEYITVYDSEQDGFSGVVTGPETVKAEFQPLVARFVKITFENPGTTIDEVEVFMVQPPVPGAVLTRNPGDEPPGRTATSMPTQTSLPTNTVTASVTNTSLPTHTPIPTDTPLPTSTSIPTDTPLPTSTLTPIPTETPLPTDTPLPTNTAAPIPSDTPLPTDRMKDMFPPGKNKVDNLAN